MSVLWTATQDLPSRIGTHDLAEHAMVVSNVLGARTLVVVGIERRYDHRPAVLRRIFGAPATCGLGFDHWP